MEKSKICCWELIDNIGILTIDNPKENYILEPDFLNFTDLIKWTNNDFLKGLIITGKGKHFSAGAKKEKIYEMACDKDVFYEKIMEGKKILDYIENLEIPTIASIRGCCLGAGLEIALACSIRICSKNSIFGFPESNLNLIPGLGGTIRLQNIIGNSRSLEMILTGNTIDSDTALNLNIVQYVIDTNNLFDFSFNLMKKMVSDKKISVIRGVLKSLNNAKFSSIDKCMEDETKIFCELAIEELKNIEKNKLEKIIDL